MLQDGNTVSNDGCSSLCATECGYLCSRGGSDSADTCRTTCGDGLLAGHEACDDANTLNGDGCNADCANVETGWTCTNTSCGQTLCMPVCGDGVRVDDEQCDDSGLANRDGCSSTCTLECGYNCKSEGADCRTTCGVGTVAGNETCDDDNENDGDGSNSSRSIERRRGCDGNVVGGAGLSLSKRSGGRRVVSTTVTRISKDYYFHKNNKSAVVRFSLYTGAKTV